MCCAVSILAVRSVTMFVYSGPMRFAISTIVVAISSMADVAETSRPGSRRDRRGTKHTESCLAGNPSQRPRQQPELTTILETKLRYHVPCPRIFCFGFEQVRLVL